VVSTRADASKKGRRRSDVRLYASLQITPGRQRSTDRGYGDRPGRRVALRPACFVPVLEAAAACVEQPPEPCWRWRPVHGGVRQHLWTLHPAAIGADWEGARPRHHPRPTALPAPPPRPGRAGLDVHPPLPHTSRGSGPLGS